MSIDGCCAQQSEDQGLNVVKMHALHW
jgi:hypothetical protein